MKIQVTQKHLDNGKRLSICECPVALALKDATGQLWLVSGIDIHRSYENSFHQLPQDVTDNIYEYDCGNKVHPFEFELDLESPV